MCEGFTRGALVRSLALILREAGWERAESTALEVLADAARDYIARLVRLAGDMAYLAGTTQLQPAHVLYSLRCVGVSLSDLEEHMQQFQTPEAVPVLPRYPVQRPDHSRQILPRDVSEYRDSTDGDDSPVVVEETGGGRFSSSEETDVEAVCSQERPRRYKKWTTAEVLNQEKKKRRKHKKSRSKDKPRKNKKVFK